MLVVSYMERYNNCVKQSTALQKQVDVLNSEISVLDTAFHNAVLSRYCFFWTAKLNYYQLPLSREQLVIYLADKRDYTEICKDALLKVGYTGRSFNHSEIDHEIDKRERKLIPLEEKLKEINLAKEQYLDILFSGNTTAQKVEYKPIIVESEKDVEKLLIEIDVKLFNHPFHKEYKELQGKSESKREKIISNLPDEKYSLYDEYRKLLADKERLETKLSVIKRKAEKEREREGRNLKTVNGRSPLQQLMDNFLLLENSGKQDTKEYSDALFVFATACTMAVLNKIKYIGTGLTPHEKETAERMKNAGKDAGKDANKKAPDKEYWGKKRHAMGAFDPGYKIRCLMAEIINGKRNLDKIELWNACARKLKHDQKGRLKSVVVDKDLNNSIVKTMDYIIGDGIDLVNDCIVAILTEINKFHAREDTNNVVIPVDFEKGYSYQKRKSKVWIKGKKTEIVTVNTCAIKEIFRYIRKRIISERGLHIDERNGYLYLPLSIRNDRGIDDLIYIRAGKYSCFSSYDVYGNICSDVNANYYIYRTRSIESMDLTPVQRECLNLRLKGYGYKSIATYRGTSAQAVVNTMKGVQAKAIKSGLVSAKKFKDAIKRELLEKAQDEYISETIHGQFIFDPSTRYASISGKYVRGLYNDVLMAWSDYRRSEYSEYTKGNYQLVQLPPYMDTNYPYIRDKSVDRSKQSVVVFDPVVFSYVSLDGDVIDACARARARFRKQTVDRACNSIESALERRKQKLHELHLRAVRANERYLKDAGMITNISPIEYCITSTPKNDSND